MKSPEDTADNLHLLLDMIVDEIPPPVSIQGEPFQMLVSDLSYSDYLGRLAIGKVVNGSAGSNETLVCVLEDGGAVPLKITKLQTYSGIGLQDAHTVDAGDIIVLSGIADVNIGDTICTREHPKPLPRIIVDEPTVFMKFMKNTSPFSGRDGKLVQASKIRERLIKESLLNVSIQVEESPDKESFIVKGRGEFQMAILIETMRREGFELCVSRPQVIFRYEKGIKMEPVENLLINCNEAFSGIVTEKLLRKKGILTHMSFRDKGRVRMEFSVPSRALIGYRDEFLTDTRGTGIMNSSYAGYEKYRGDFPVRFSGSLVSDRQGTAVPFALYNLEPRGKIFIQPGDAVYEGMIIGEHNRDTDLNVNPCKTKKLTNLRASGKDEAITLTPVIPMTLEKAIQFIREDEQVEVTPKIVRLRKAVLSIQERKSGGRHAEA